MAGARVEGGGTSRLLSGPPTFKKKSLNPRNDLERLPQMQLVPIHPCRPGIVSDNRLGKIIDRDAGLLLYSGQLVDGVVEADDHVG